MDEELNKLLSVMQGFSNASADVISAPIDGINWLMRKAGVKVSNTPIGGSAWMQKKGLTAIPQNYNYGQVGQAIGSVLPIVASARAPQIARHILEENEASAFHSSGYKQRGMIRIPGAGRIPENGADVNALTAALQKKSAAANIDPAIGYSNVSPSNYASFTNPAGEKFQVRISNHADRYPNNFPEGQRFSVDPSTRNTYEDSIKWLNDNGINFKKQKIPMPDWVAAKPEYAGVFDQVVNQIKASDPNATSVNYMIKVHDLGYKLAKASGLI